MWKAVLHALLVDTPQLGQQRRTVTKLLAPKGVQHGVTDRLTFLQQRPDAPGVVLQLLNQDR